MTLVKKSDLKKLDLEQHIALLKTQLELLSLASRNLVLKLQGPMDQIPSAVTDLLEILVRIEEFK